MALLGEMYYRAHGASSWYNLPREDGIAYAAQESWVLNETIRVRFLVSPLTRIYRYFRIIFSSENPMMKTAMK